MKLLLLLVLSLSLFNTHALQIISEFDPPYNYLDKNQKPKGLTVEIVQEIQRRVGNSDKITFYPWARAYNLAKGTSNIVLFSMARTKERMNRFNWIGPVIDNSWVLIAKAESPLNKITLEEAKKLHSIGVYRDDGRDIYLTKKGFKNLTRSNLNQNGFNMLMANRFDAYAAIDVSLEKSLKELGHNINQVKTILTLKTVQVFITISKGTDPTIVKKWQDAFYSMRQDGTYRKIFKKYFPRKKLPSPHLESL